MDKKVSYKEAIEEIRGILRRVEGEEVDLDQLVTEVERAAELLVLCRSRIQNAEVNIKRVLDNLGDLLEQNEPDSVKS